MNGKRILVIGSPGSGKSTFARELAKMTDLPLFYLDMIYHNADHTTISKEEFDEKLQAVLMKDSWIIDGNYLRTMKMRLDRCDTVFFFDLPCEVCLEGVRSRIGTKRDDMPWIEEEEDEEFMNYIRDFPYVQLPDICTILREYEKERTVIRFMSRREADAWLKENR